MTIRKTILDSAAEVAQFAASAVVADLSAAIAEYGNATWVIAGGSTPSQAYKLLAEQNGSKVDWSLVTVLIGDERCVPYSSPDSSWKSAAELFLSHVPIPSDQLLRPIETTDAEEAAVDYASKLKSLPTVANGAPRLDHVWIGMGEDGHTLSLFPGHPSYEDTDARVIPVHNSPKPPPDRISLTRRGLEGVGTCLVLSTGSGKAEAVARALNGDTTLPVAGVAEHISKSGGIAHWVLDSAAASQAQ